MNSGFSTTAAVFVRLTDPVRVAYYSTDRFIDYAEQGASALGRLGYKVIIHPARVFARAFP